MRSSGITTLASGASSAFDAANFFSIHSGLSTVPIGSTLARLRLDISLVRTAGVSEVPEIFAGALVGPSSLDAIDMNPSDNTQYHLDWLWWRKLFLRTDTAGFATKVEVDGKAMRKFEELNSTLWLCFGNTSADTVQLKFASSALVLLP